jgi:MoaA/NifB/PqqE/SkfB family radical SAM enzyme
MDTDTWKAVLDRVWQVSIPHVCFTGGEATMREDLVELVAYAEGLGLVTGLLTNGRRLSDAAYVQALIAAGLDHVQITLESHDEAVHDSMQGVSGAWRETVQGVRNAVAASLYTITNTTLTRENVAEIERTVTFIASLGMPAFACNSLIYAGRGHPLPELLRATGIHPARSLGGHLEPRPGPGLAGAKICPGEMPRVPGISSMRRRVSAVPATSPARIHARNCLELK